MLALLAVGIPSWGAPAPARTVVDGAGRTIQVPDRPTRIVSLAPSATEILFALGAGERVVGVTDFCEYPPEAARLPRIGGLINPDLERILGLRPDLAVASTAGNYLDDTERLTALGVPVYAIETPDVAGVLAAFAGLGHLLGETERAQQVVAGLRERIEKVRAAAAGRPHPVVLFVIEPDPLIAPGPETFVGEALRIAGGVPAATGTGARWAQYDLEQVIAMRPEVILTTRAHAPWAERLPAMSDWRALPAVVNGRIHVVSDAIQNPGPRLIDGIEEVAEILRRTDAGR
jgi:iron complex transport system substrate-binding protein